MEVSRRRLHLLPLITLKINPLTTDSCGWVAGVARTGNCSSVWRKPASVPRRRPDPKLLGAVAPRNHNLSPTQPCAQPVRVTRRLRPDVRKESLMRLKWSRSAITIPLRVADPHDSLNFTAQQTHDGPAVPKASQMAMPRALPTPNPDALQFPNSSGRSSFH
jgi:hypothetical protein